MNALRGVYRRLDRNQRTLWFRVAATLLVLAVCGTVFGSLIGTTISLDRQRQALLSALAGQSLTAGDEHALTLRASGTITLNGRTYGGPRFAQQPELLFDEDGMIAVSIPLADALLGDQYPTWAPRWLLEQPGTTWMLAGITTAWLLLIVWLAITVPFVIAMLGTGIAVSVALLDGRPQLAWALGGIGSLTFTFVLLTRVALLLLDRPNQVFAVAHTVVREASRTRIALVFIVFILILLPLLPLGLDHSSPLRFQIQTFISRSLGFTFYIAACMTLVLSCASVAFEIRDRQIWQLMTKPVSRAGYLLGKWLGVITINVIILSIAAVSIFTFIQYLREQPVATGMRGYEDAQQVRDAVLTARVGRMPAYEVLTAEQLRARVDEVIVRTPEYSVLEEVPLSLRRRIEGEILNAWAAAQRSVPPGQMRDFVFEGLDAARRLQSTLTLRYRFHIMRDDEHETFPAVFFFNRDVDLRVDRTYVPTMSHVLTIPVELIQEDGTLIVSIANGYQAPPRPGAGALNFEEADFELLYKVGSFEANFVRAVFVDWVKLAFLAMLGICCSTFLSFPVACLMSFTIFIAGTIGPFLADSLHEYYPPPTAAVDWGDLGMVIQWAFKSAIRFVAQMIVFLLQAFGQYRPTQLLVEGRLIAWSAVALGSLKVGVVWTGLALGVGLLVIRRRQLAIYSGHG